MMAQVHSSRCILPAIFYFFLLGLVQSQACYWPDGTTAGSLYVPCPGSNGIGPCCYGGGPSLSDLCYSNGFCYSIVLGKIYRGACSDQSWSVGAGCAAQCLNNNPDNTIDVSPCLDTKICCGDGDNVTSCCTNGDGFAWDNATFLSRDAAVTITTTTSTITQLATATVSQQTPTNASGASNCHKQSVALGAGLGLPLGLALLSAALLGYRLFNLKYTRRDYTGRGQNTTTVVRHTGKAIPAELGGHVVTELPAAGISRPM